MDGNSSFINTDEMVTLHFTGWDISWPVGGNYPAFEISLKLAPHYHNDYIYNVILFMNNILLFSNKQSMNSC